MATRLLMLRAAVVVPVLIAITAITGAYADDASMNPSLACLASLADKPGLQILKDKVALADPNTQTLEMLASNKKPTQAEKAAISAWVSEQGECLKTGEAWRASNFPPAVNSLLDQYWASYKGTAADLYAGNITYGAFAKAREMAVAKFKSDVAAVAQQLRAQQEVQNRAQAQEDQRRQEAAAVRLHEEEMQDAQLRAQAVQAEQARRNAALMRILQTPPVQVPLYQMPTRSTTNTNCSPDGAGGFRCTSN